eukprot:513066-Pleurochrysis_carterae.AAC.1
MQPHTPVRGAQLLPLSRSSRPSAPQIYALAKGGWWVGRTLLGHYIQTVVSEWSHYSVTVISDLGADVTVIPGSTLFKP